MPQDLFTGSFGWLLPILVVLMVYALFRSPGSRLGTFLLAPFRSKGQLTLQAPSTVARGQALPATVLLTVTKELAADQVFAELAGYETYYEYRHSGRHRYRVRLVEPFARIPHVLLQQAALPKGVQQRWEVSFPVPLSEPPSGKGTIVEVAWRARAVVSVSYRPDLVQEKPIQVRSLAQDSRPGWGDLQKEEKQSFEECTLALALRQAEVVAGQSVRGRLQMQATRPFACRSLRVELVCSEVAGEERREVVVSPKVLEGPAEFQSYQSRTLDFVLALPSDACPTVETPHSSLRWKVRAVVDRRLRNDRVVEQEVHAYSASASP